MIRKKDAAVRPFAKRPKVRQVYSVRAMNAKKPSGKASEQFLKWLGVKHRSSVSEKHFGVIIRRCHSHDIGRYEETARCRRP